MSSRTLTSQVDSSAYAETQERFAPDFFYSGERICPPPDRGHANAVTGVYAAAFLALGIGWAMVGKKPEWMSTVIEQAYASLSAPSADNRAAQPVVPAGPDVAHDIPAAGVQPIGSAADAKITSSPTAVASGVTDPADQVASSGLPPVMEVAAAPAIAEAPATPPTAPADRYQQQAAGVGLNPDLSHVLLARLSPADYRNAGIAIEKAVAKTPDGGELVWPSRRKPELALFKVHFVQGAAPGCRRYVVTVTKDGWTTTALPMEKCGSPLVQGRSAEQSP